MSTISPTNSPCASNAGGIQPFADRPSVPPDGTPELRKRILDRVIGLTRAASVPKPWTFLGSIERERQLNGSPEELLNGLREAFTDEQLIENRILFMRKGGKARIAPALTQGTFSVIKIGKIPVDVASDQGALFTTAPPALYFGRQRTKANTAPARVLLAQAENLVVLRHFFRSTTTAGLAQLTGKQARKLFGAQGTFSKPKYKLVVVDLEVARLQYLSPPCVRPILERFYQVAELYFEQHEVFVESWRPSEDNFRKFCRAVQFRDARLVKRILSESLRNDTVHVVEAWNRAVDGQSVDLLTAYRELAGAIEESRHLPQPNRTRKSLEKYLRAGERLYERYLLESESASTGTKSALIRLAGEVHRAIHTAHPIVSAANAVINHEPPCDHTTCPSDILDGYVRLANFLLKIDRQLK